MNSSVKFLVPITTVAAVLSPPEASVVAPSVVAAASSSSSPPQADTDMTSAERISVSQVSLRHVGFMGFLRC